MISVINMGKIKIICTSTGCLEYAPEKYKNADIDIIRIHMFFQNKEYLEGPDLDPWNFYKVLENVKDVKVSTIAFYFAYYVTVYKGLNVDKPRNLAKSVTVE